MNQYYLILEPPKPKRGEEQYITIVSEKDRTRGIVLLEIQAKSYEEALKRYSFTIEHNKDMRTLGFNGRKIYAI